MPTQCFGTPFSAGVFSRNTFAEPVFQVSIQKLQSIERSPGMTRVGVLPFGVGHLIFRCTPRNLNCDGDLLLETTQ
jgi:hypothetical protein